MLRLSDKGFSVSRGDTGSICFRLTCDSMPEGTVAVFTAAKKPGLDAPIWQKQCEINGFETVLALAAENTDLRAGTYFWDMRLVLPGGRVITPFEPKQMEVLDVVGRV